MAEEISIKEACELLGVTKATVYAHIKKGNLHPIKKLVGAGVGGTRTWLPRAEVEALKSATAPTVAPLDRGLGAAGLTHRPAPTRAKRSTRTRTRAN